jgi:hypothetical protein
MPIIEPHRAGRLAAIALTLFLLAPLISRSQEADSVSAGEGKLPARTSPVVNELPSQVRSTLDKRYPGWVYVDNYALFKRLPEEIVAEYPFNPNCIRGDFNGDQIDDYAVQIAQVDSSDSTHLFIAFLSTGGRYEPFVLEANPGYADEYLWLSTKGSEYYDFETDQTGVFPNDAISIVIWEKAATTYSFKDGTFVEIVTGD